MSFLITGGAGYIGSHMVYQLTDAGERVVVLDNLSTGFEWAVTKDVPLIVGEAGDQNLVAQIIRQHDVDSITHFAAWLVVRTRLLRFWRRHSHTSVCSLFASSEK
jgi:UDP-glucose 4-epimerase